MAQLNALIHLSSTRFGTVSLPKGWNALTMLPRVILLKKEYVLLYVVRFRPCSRNHIHSILWQRVKWKNPIELTHSLSPLASSLNAAITTLLVVLELSDITALVFPIKNRLNPHRLHILIDRQTVLWVVRSGRRFVIPLWEIPQIHGCHKQEVTIHTPNTWLALHYHQ